MTVPLQIVDVSRAFGGVQAVSDVSFEVPQSAICALVGPNGAGKTTLFNMVTNIFPPTAGHILFQDRPLTNLSSAQIARLGLIRTFQSARVFPGMTVLENVLVGRHRLLRHGLFASMFCTPAARHGERQIRYRAERLLDLAGLLAHRNDHAVTLPMGAQKLLEIVRALMAQPRLLLLDEPAAGLNDAETEDLAELLRAIRAAGMTILLVEHNMPLVMGVADQVLVLEAGRLIAAGPPGAVRSDPRVIDAYLGTPA